MHSLSKWWSSFIAWLRANKSAHERAIPHGCCSEPPPGAGHTIDKGK